MRPVYGVATSLMTAVDSFVKTTNRPEYGVGRLVAIDQAVGSAELEFFVAPGCDPIEFTTQLESVRDAPLARQTRVYVSDPDGNGWIAGRVIEDGEVPAHALDREAFPRAPEEGLVYLVRFPRGLDVALRPSELEVRWGMPVDDPVDWLAARANEGPFLYAKRSRILKEVLRQRALYRGLTGLASASIDLLEHQVKAVRRVLEDPVRRYVLADEVGLGKTIEAGIILRQHLLDRKERGLGLIVVPPHLQEQWHQELTGKLGLPTRCFRLLAPGELAKGLEMLPREPSILILDEAHHASTYAYSDTASEKQVFSALKLVSASAADVLLLSATPVLRNEAGFLAMLHLLDPDVYRLEDVEEFRGFIAKREPVAQILDDLDGSPNEAILEDALFDAEDVLDSDERAAELIAELRSALAQEMDEAARRRAIDRLRLHIQERHRLHHRLIRTRRAQSLVRNMLPSRTHELVEYDDPLRGEANTLLDEWRFRVLDASKPDGAPEPARLFRLWLEAMLEHPSRLAAMWRRHAEMLSSGAEDEVFEGEEEFLLNGAEKLDREDDAQFQAVLSAVRGHLPNRDSKVVVFASDPRIADELAQRLSEWMPGGPVRLDPHDHGVLRAFLSENSVPVLVVDRHSEEGLNLQGVPATVTHADLPLAPMRVEQRIGRLDRLGATSMSVLSVVPYSRDGYEHAVADLLAAVGVFEASVAPLQFLLDEVRSWVADRLFEHGTDAIRDAIEVIRTEGHRLCLDDERRRIRRQDLIDDAGYLASDRSYYSALENYEYGSEVEGFAKALQDWLGDGALGLRKLSTRGDRVVRYQYSASRGQLPGQTSRHCSLRRLTEGFDVAVHGQRHCRLPWIVIQQNPKGFHLLVLGTHWSMLWGVRFWWMSEA